MKDPVSIGAVVSMGVLVLLAVWKTRRLRWIILSVLALLFVLGAWADLEGSAARGHDAAAHRHAFISSSARMA